MDEIPGWLLGLLAGSLLGYRLGRSRGSEQAMLAALRYIGA